MLLYISMTPQVVSVALVVEHEELGHDAQSAVPTSCSPSSGDDLQSLGEREPPRSPISGLRSGVPHAPTTTSGVGPNLGGPLTTNFGVGPDLAGTPTMTSRAGPD